MYEVNVSLQQTATVAVEAESREEAWEAVQTPLGREAAKVLASTDFHGAFYQPEDIDEAGHVSDVDLSTLDEESG